MRVLWVQQLQDLPSDIVVDKPAPPNGEKNAPRRTSVLLPASEHLFALSAPFPTDTPVFSPTTRLHGVSTVPQPRQSDRRLSSYRRASISSTIDHAALAEAHQRNDCSNACRSRSIDATSSTAMHLYRSASLPDGLAAAVSPSLPLLMVVGQQRRSVVRRRRSTDHVLDACHHHDVENDSDSESCDSDCYNSDSLGDGDSMCGSDCDAAMPGAAGPGGKDASVADASRRTDDACHDSQTVGDVGAVPPPTIDSSDVPVGACGGVDGCGGDLCGGHPSAADVTVSQIRVSGHGEDVVERDDHWLPEVPRARRSSGVGATTAPVAVTPLRGGTADPAVRSSTSASRTSSQQRSRLLMDTILPSLGERFSKALPLPLSLTSQCGSVLSESLATSPAPIAESLQRLGLGIGPGSDLGLGRPRRSWTGPAGC